MPQLTFNPDELEKQAFSTPENTVFKGEIVEIVELSNEDVYGDKAKDPNRMGMNVKVRIPTLDNREFHEYFNYPRDEVSWLNVTFKLRKFVKKYGVVPRVGNSVSCIVNSEGFFSIVM